MLSRGKLSQISTAFKSVYGVNASDEQALVRYGMDVIFHASPYPFEDGDLIGFRLANIHELDDTAVIMEYLSKIPEDKFQFTQTSTYGKLFELGKAYNVGYKGNEGVPVKPNTSVVEDFNEPESKTVSNSVGENSHNDHANGMEHNVEEHMTNPLGEQLHYEPYVEAIDQNKEYKENTKMNETTNPITALEAQAAALGVGTAVGNNANVTEVSSNDKKAAMKVIEASQASRMDYSKNAKITRVLVTKISREDKAVDGRAAKGVIADVDKAIKKFNMLTGCDDSNGEVKFPKMHASMNYSDMLKVYELLQAAKENPNMEVEPYFGKADAPTPVSIKGVVLEDPNNKEILLAQKDLAQHILRNGFLYLNVASASNAQFQLDAAKTKNGAQPKKSYVVRVANKSDLLEDKNVCVDAKIVTKEVSESESGFKSALSIVVNSDKNDSHGEPKKITWRIPLSVRQYEVQIVDQYSDLFQTGVGAGTKRIEASDPAAVAKVSETLSAILATELTQNPDSAIIGAALGAKLREEKSKLQNEQIREANATLGNQQSEEDFGI